MNGKILLGVLTAVTFAQQPATGATGEILVTDAAGRPLPEAVIQLGLETALLSPAASELSAESIIDQRHETFLPLVTLIRAGGHVIFTNNDTTMHQVYSFSAIKQFALEIGEGQRSQPVVFDKPGIAAIGCNIHDQMITYVVVASQPWGAVSDSAGKATVLNIPPGRYHGSAWQPGLSPGAAPRVFELNVSIQGGRATVSLPVEPVHRKSSTHMQMY